MPNPRGLFLNTLKARCSIHESGMMAYQALLKSDLYSLDYQEVSSGHRLISQAYDFYVFNYHFLTSMSWLDTGCIRNLPGLKITLVLEVAPDNPFVYVSPEDFDAYIVMDPTIGCVTSRVYPFPRPLEAPPELPEYQPLKRPIIGTFGISSEGKGFDKLVLAVNREFESAEIHMNVLIGDYHRPDASLRLSKDIASYRQLAKPGIELVVTHEFMSKPDLIRWCATHTLNCFLYDRSMAGLSATTDQAIASGRPLAVSTNETFRHIHDYLKPYPLRSLRDSIQFSGREVAALQEAWSQVAFARKFESLLAEHKVVSNQPRQGSYLLKSKRFTHPIFAPLKRVQVSDFVPPFLPKAYANIRSFFIKNQPPAGVLLLPNANRLISSASQFGEDLWLDYFMVWKKTGFYVDVGTHHPQYHNNTYRFYSRGWSGINIVPSLNSHRAFAEQRPGDLNLTVSETTILSPSLSEIFRQHATTGQSIDFLSMDFDEITLDVLKSHDWTSVRPNFLLVKMTHQPDAIRQLMNRMDYMHLINNSTRGLFVDSNCRIPFMEQLLENAHNIRAS